MKSFQSGTSTPMPVSLVSSAFKTVAVLSSFFYLMETHPEIQRRAQAEVDSVTGGNRLPIPDDEKSMPFVTAMIKDILRWAPVGK